MYPSVTWPRCRLRSEMKPIQNLALSLGPWRHNFTVDEPFEFHWPKEPIRALGIFISYHQKQNEGRNFKAKVDKVSSILDIWQSLSRTLFGRILITKYLGILQLVYSILILDISSEYIKASNSLFLKFIWKTKQDKIKWKVLSLYYSDAGRFTRAKHWTIVQVTKTCQDRRLLKRAILRGSLEDDSQLFPE